MTPTPPVPPLELPAAVRAWAGGRCDRCVSRRADGSLTLVLFLPGETCTARFPSSDAAAAALLAHEVKWESVRVDVGAIVDPRSGKPRRGP